MLAATCIVALETFTLLRRDKVIAPVIGVAVAVAIFAVLASDWSVEDFTKILYDVGFFGFYVTGSLIALFFGTKTVGDSRQEGSLEVQLAAPIGRGTWLLGKFLGLGLTLILVGCVVLVLWQAAMLVGNFGWMTAPQLLAFAFLVVSWLVLSAAAVFLASMMRAPLAFFCGLALWVLGLASSLVANALGSETPALTRKVVGWIARIWDLQQFNLIGRVLDKTLMPGHEIAVRSGYGVVLILLFITVSYIVFSRRDALA